MPTPVTFVATVKKVSSTQKPDQDGSPMLVVDIAMQTTLEGGMAEVVAELAELQTMGAVTVTCVRRPPDRREEKAAH